jgi:hypothetical protein
MALKALSLIVLCLSTILPAPLSAQTQKVRFSVSAVSIAEVPFKMLKSAIDFTQESLGGAVKEIAPIQVFDFVQKAGR